MPPELDPDVLAFAHQMFELARGGASEQLAAYVDAGLPVNLTNDKGDTLLMLAAYHAHPGTVRVLLEGGADTGRVNDRGQTPLGAAVFRQSAETVSLLLAAGADPALGAPSALEMARFFELPDLLAMLGSPRRSAREVSEAAGDDGDLGWGELPEEEEGVRRRYAEDRPPHWTNEGG